MGRPKKWPPGVRTKAGREYAWHAGKWHPLGPAGTDAAKAEYARLVALWSAGAVPGRPRGELLFTTLFADYVVSGHVPDSRLSNARCAVRLFDELFPVQPVEKFKPADLAAFQTHLCRGKGPPRPPGERAVSGRARGPEGGLYSRHYILSIKRFVLSAVKWGVAHRDVDPHVALALDLVPDPPEGLTRRARKVKPAAAGDVDRVCPLLPAQLAACLRLMLLTGMRPSEALGMVPRRVVRGGVAEVPGEGERDLGELWMLVFDEHKTEHHGVEKFVLLGPAGRELLAPFLRGDPDAPCFPKPPRMLRGRVGGGRCSGRGGGGFMSASSFREWVQRAARLAGVTGSFFPYMARHAAARDLDRAHGREAARAALGHTSTAMTDHYAGRNFEAARKAAR